MALNSSNIPGYVQVVVNPYSDKDSKNRKGIIIGGPWTDVIALFIRDNDIKAVYLNSVKGWCDTDYSFLCQLNSIEELSIISSEATGLMAIEEMVNLRELSITTSTKDKVDFTKLLKLEKCYLYWWKGAQSILECIQIKNLYLDKLKLKDYTKLTNLKYLDSLTIANCQVESIDWLKDYNNLNELVFLNCKKLNDFSPIKNCSSLKRLTISGSKLLNDLNFVKGLNNLEVLVVSDNSEINSLAPLVKIRSLKALSFAGNTVIKDGDLSVIIDLPKLSMLMFQARRHYSHKLIKKWSWKNFDTPDTLLKNAG